MGYSSPVLFLKRKQHNLYRVVNNFGVSNERLIRVNHIFQKGLRGIYTIIDLRNTYHTLD